MFELVKIFCLFESNDFKNKLLFISLDNLNLFMPSPKYFEKKRKKGKEFLCFRNRNDTPMNIRLSNDLGSLFMVATGV